MMVSYSELFSENKLFVYMINIIGLYLYMIVYVMIYNVD